MPFLAAAIPWRLIAGIGLAFGLFLGAMYVVGQLKKVGALTEQNKHLATAVTEQAAATSAERDGRLKSEAAILDRDKALAALRRASSAQKRRNQNAVDGPLAPVLAGQLQCLRQRSNNSGAGEGPAGGSDCRDAAATVPTP